MKVFKPFKEIFINAQKIILNYFNPLFHIYFKCCNIYYKLNFLFIYHLILHFKIILFIKIVIVIVVIIIAIIIEYFNFYITLTIYFH
jgi:hypothetical protein